MIKTATNIQNFPGLSETEAGIRLARDGHNELPASKQKSTATIAFEVIKEPMFLLLISGGGIYLLLGDVVEALLLLCFVFLVIGITLYQERKTERALEALRDLASPRALVIRDGAPKRIPGRDVVRGDIIVLAEGDRVPADAIVLSCVNLFVDESLLTGESIPVRKTPAESSTAMSRPGGDCLPCVFSGTLVVQGFGVAESKAIGEDTEIGKIGTSLNTIVHERTRLQKETAKLVRNLALIGLALFVLVVVAYGLTRGNWLNGLLAGITLAMAMLPEEFPVVLTIFLALGAWRISQKRVLTRRVPAVETLGSATVLCVDKTGTLTLNRMSVKKVFSGNTFYDLAYDAETINENIHELVEFSILASQAAPFDPMEMALRELGNRTLADTGHLHDDWVLVEEYPLSPELLAMSRVWKSPDSKDFIIAAKGSPEAIADICHLDETLKEQITRAIDTMAVEGLRVIGIARSVFSKGSLPAGQHDFVFDFMGLIGLADPVRPGVTEAVKECSEAGIRVVMITGDYPVTAQNIAAEVGLKNRAEVITGPEIEKMSAAELRQKIGNVDIFARVAPEQKLFIVNALKANGEVVAMTGDGVNDAAALKAAHIGIAMGGRGTDVAREASAIVLLDDDFTSIVQAVRMGRRIFDNLKKAMVYIFAVHVPIAGMSLLPVLLHWPLVLLPVHIVFLELIIDPACSIVFEAETEESDIMKRPPRSLGVPLFGHSMIAFSLLQGAAVLLVVFLVYVTALYRNQGESEARTLCFTTLIIANLGLILTNRSWTRSILRTFRYPNPALWMVLGGAVLFLGIVLYTPFMHTLFQFNTLHGIDLALCFSAGIVSIVWFEIIKLRKASRVAS